MQNESITNSYSPKNIYINNNINNNKIKREEYFKYLSDSKDKYKKCKKLNNTITKNNYHDFLKK
jgi:hypothetical protein